MRITQFYSTRDGDMKNEERKAVKKGDKRELFIKREGGVEQYSSELWNVHVIAPGRRPSKYWYYDE